MKSLTRDEFREAVLARDGNRCVLCGSVANAVHHIMERKLFSDGGYHLHNGASVCDDCHVCCEITEISVEEVRWAADIKVLCLPPGFDPMKRYDKWGNEVLEGGLLRPGPLADDDGCRKALKAAGKLSRLLSNDP